MGTMQMHDCWHDAVAQNFEIWIGQTDCLAHHPKSEAGLRAKLYTSKPPGT